jgi:ComF family protein
MVEARRKSLLLPGNQYDRSGDSCQLLKFTWINNCLESAQSLVFPSLCVLCGSQSEDKYDICQACRDELPRLTVACQRCALPLSDGQAGICGRCMRRTPAFEHTYAVFHYASPVDFLIQRLKFNRKLNHARLLGSLMADELSKRYATAAGDLPEVIIPVPLHPSRLCDRGYNQALELARPVAALLNIAVDHQSCTRTRETAMQSDLPAKLRRKNVKGAFQIRGIDADHVAIIDDVMTTGYTVDELAGAMRGYGVKKIDVWVCARASYGR